jgi:hypothetical protein
VRRVASVGDTARRAAREWMEIPEKLGQRDSREHGSSYRIPLFLGFDSGFAIVSLHRKLMEVNFDAHISIKFGASRR